MKHIAIVDCNALCHEVKHATRELSFRGEKTGIIFGFLKKLISIQKQIIADRYVFVWDSKIGYMRSRLFPQYKRDMKAQPLSDEDILLNKIAYPQFDLLYEQVLPKIGFNCNWRFDLFEADDAIASIAYKHHPFQIK